MSGGLLAGAGRAKPAQGRQDVIGSTAAIGVGVAQAGRVVQQHPEAHWNPGGVIVCWDRPTLEVAVDGLIQGDLLGGKQLHRCEGSEGLGDRLGLKQGVVRHGAAARAIRHPETPGPGDAPVLNHRHRSTRDVVLLAQDVDPLLQRAERLCRSSC